MIIVTGTKRSGTSLWMRILMAAGFPAFGSAFPRNWGETIRDANPEGFYESLLRMGIYHETNPHPVTGKYFPPQAVERHAVKIFVGGLVRTDLAFIGKVVATIRPWREYVASVERLYALMDAKRREGEPKEPRLDPVLEWFWENFALIRDIAMRRYPAHVQSYDGLLDDPSGVIQRTLAWIGGDVDVSRAIATVDPQRRTHSDPPTPEGVDPAHAELFDVLYDTIHRGHELSASLVDELNAVNDALAPRMEEERARLAEARRLHAPPSGDPAARLDSH